MSGAEPSRMKPVHFLHIGKTGGSALKHVFESSPGPSGIVLHNHWTRLADVPEGERVIFVVRDPVDRYVSGFNSRLRRGRPRYDSPWTPAEETSFGRFPSANVLAEALSADEPDERAAAESAMESILHTRLRLSYWLGSVSDLDARKSDILFIGHLPSLTDDFAQLRGALNLPPEASLPDDDVVSHRTPPGMDLSLSPLGRANLERWYAEDLDLYEHCLRIRQEIRSRLRPACLESAR